VIPCALVLACAAAVSATNDPYEFILMPQMSMTVSAAPIVAAALGVFLPLFVAWRVEGGVGARVGAAIGIAPVVIAFALAGLGFISWRTNKREREAM
jgi:CDP-diacylglycerol pyrophosphatase